jgi:glucose 1-dehydrogenase
MGQLSGKIAVITGGTRGFGLAMAEAYAREGATVVVSSRSPEAVEGAVQRLRALGGQADGLACDVGELAQVQALVDFAIQTFGNIDVWVNNAGMSLPYGPTAHVQVEDFSRVTRTNILGTYHGSLVAMRYFLERGRGKLINILGMGERRPAPMQNAYGSSKAWVRNFTLALADEYKASGIGVFLISPGMMDTEMLTDVEVIAGYEDRLKSFGSIVQALSQPPDVSAARAVWMASAATDGKTGLVGRELTGPKVMTRFLHQRLNRLLGRPGRPVEVKVTTVPAAYPGKDKQ